MKSEKLPLYALAAAILIVGLVALGVPIGTIFFLAILAACPLMMFFMMSSMHGGGTHGGHGRSDEATDRDHDPLRKNDQQHPYGHGRS
ncbi:DUF2933 domain-containing protein [Streptomyces sp. NPDC059690]|uniref:DUF2933 domain-containing protein n=1 Tax=Streptomyces sp. NPDC059690 TaxID=3346907 RepID=UPI0036A79BD3